MEFSSSEKFALVFRGLERAYGTFVVEGTNAKGKHKGRGGYVKKPRTAQIWEAHLTGDGIGIGIIPINEQDNCFWGALDLDEYPFEHKPLVDKINKLELPLIVCRSKSGGAHVYLFVKKGIPAELMRRIMVHLGSVLGHSANASGNPVEIYPKQITLHSDRDDGSYLNLPYYAHENTLRYAFKEDGEPASLEEFLGLYDKRCIDGAEAENLLLVKTPASDSLFADGPPCLNVLTSDGSKIGEGGRNNGLFNIAVYLRKKYPDSYQQEILKYNELCLDPPLSFNEVSAVVDQVGKKDYFYKCRDIPICQVCEKSVCQTRLYGIGGDGADVMVENLRKFNSSPPVWFCDVSGQPVELDSDSLLLQPNFQKKCLEQLNILPATVSKKVWEQKISSLLSDMRELGAIESVSEDASIHGQFFGHLYDFCTAGQRAEDREEILLRKPFYEEEKIYFRLRDLERFLKQAKFFEYKSHQLAQRLREVSGESTQLSIKNKSIRVWAIPQYQDDVPLSLTAKEFSDDVPF